MKAREYRDMMNRDLTEEEENLVTALAMLREDSAFNNANWVINRVGFHFESAGDYRAYMNGGEA